MSGTPARSAARRVSLIAVICGTPTPATTRVVQIEPGTDADLDAVRAGLDESARGVLGRDVAGHDVDGHLRS